MTTTEIITAIKSYFSENEKKLQEGGLLSAYIVSSLARGDFLDGGSDADVLLIFKKGCTNEEIQQTWKCISEELNTCFLGQKCTHPHFIDLPWEVDGKYKKSLLKCFKFFFDDLKKNNIHVFGKDIIANLNLENPSQQDYVDKIKQLLEKYGKSDSKTEKTLFVGETIKHFLKLNGISSLNKFEIFNSLSAKDHPEIHEFYRRYTENDLSNPKQNDLNDKIVRKINFLLKQI